MSAPSRRALPRRSFLTGGAAVALGCESDATNGRGRQVLRLWFSYGGKNRAVLERLVAAYNASQRDVLVRAVFQGDYYEALAKLRVALAAKAAPALSHVVGEIVPYLSEAGVLDRFSDYPSTHAADVVPALGQTGSWLGGEHKPLVAQPFNRSTPIAYLNGALFGAAGLSAPAQLGRAAANCPRPDSAQRCSHAELRLWLPGRLVVLDGAARPGGR
ncbi:MAG: hypothetical protein QM756_11795 [Polyangiaceae bacterium]